MQDVNPPAFPPQWQPLVDRAANGLRQLAWNVRATRQHGGTGVVPDHEWVPSVWPVPSITP
jgi:hypothetical protein